MSAIRYPRRIESVHVESFEGELSVYDTARLRVHSLNHIAAFVWQRCDGRTAPAALAAALAAESIDEAAAVVQLTLQQLAAAKLLVRPIEKVARVSRRDLLRRGVAAAAVPAIHSIVAPSPAQAQSVPPPAAPTLTSVSPDQGLRGATVAVTLTGTNFVVGATTVNVGGGGVTVNTVVVGNSTSLTANFVLDLAANGPRTVTVTTAGGTSGAQTFTVTLPPPGFIAFDYTGGPETFTVPAGVVSITVLASGAGGGAGSGAGGGLGGRATATLSVTPGTALTVRVGGAGLGTMGGFNGGAEGVGFGAYGGGASSVHNGATALVVVGGGGGGGAAAGGSGGAGGAGGGLLAGPGATPPLGGGGGGGGTQAAGGAGGTRGSSTGTDGTAGMADTGGISGADQSGVIGGGGGGGGYFGGGGGGGGNPSTAGGGGGGGGSSFTAPGATAVVHDQGVKAGNGFVTISW